MHKSYTLLFLSLSYFLLSLPDTLVVQATEPSNDSPRLKAILRDVIESRHHRRKKTAPYHGYDFVSQFKPLGMSENLSNLPAVNQGSTQSGARDPNHYFLYALIEKHKGNTIQKKYLLYDKKNKTMFIYPILSLTQQKQKEDEIKKKYGVEKGNIRSIGLMEDKLVIDGLPYQLFFYSSVIIERKQKKYLLDIILKKDDKYYWAYRYVAFENLHAPLKVTKVYKGLTDDVILVVEKQSIDHQNHGVHLYEVPIFIEGIEILSQKDLIITPENNWQLAVEQRQGLYQRHLFYPKFNATAFYKRIIYRLDGSYIEQKY